MISRCLCPSFSFSTFHHHFRHIPFISRLSFKECAILFIVLLTWNMRTPYNVSLVGVLCKCSLGKKRLQMRPLTREMEEDNAYEIVHHPIFVLQRMGKLLCSERNRDLSIKAISLYNRCTCMHTNGAIIKNLFNKMQFLVDQWLVLIVRCI